MAALIGALRVTLGADTAAFSSGMKRAERQAASSSAIIQKSLIGIKAAATGIAAGLTLGALTSMASKALDYASSLGEVAQQLGVSTKQLQVFRYAASQVGVSQEAMDKSLGKLNITLGQAKEGAKAPIAAFGALSKLIGKDIVASSKQGGDAIPLVADGLAKVGDRSKRAAIEVALFGRAGAQLDTFLAGGSRGINELAESAEKLGIVLSDDQIRNADETADKLSAVKQVLEARIAGVVADNAQSILTLANALSAVAAGVIKFLASNPAKAAALLGAIGGYAVGGPVGAAAGALAAAGYATINSEQGLKDQLHTAIKSRRNFYLQNGGTQAELSSGKLNPGVVKKLQGKSAFRELHQRIQGFRSQIALVSGGGSVAAPATAEDGDLGKFLGGAGKKAPKGKSAESLAREAESRRKAALRDSFDAASDQRRADTDILRARQDLSTDIKERAQIEREILQKEYEERQARIELDLGLGDINETTAKKRRESEATLASLQLEKADRDETHDLLQEELRIRDSVAEFAADTLQTESALASTAAERREIESRILDARLKMLRQAQQDIIDNKDGRYNEYDINLAKRTLGHIDRVEPLQREALRRDTSGPLESFMNSLPDTAAKANEALQSVAANGISSIVDGLADAISGARSLGDVFKNVARQIIADLIRIQIQKAIVGGLSKLIGSFTGGLGSGGLSGSAAANRSMVGDIPGFAKGGSIKVGGISGVDKNLLSLNGLPIARVNMGERISVDPSNDNARGGGLSMTINAPGATAETVMMIRREMANAAPALIAASRSATRRDLGRRTL